MAGLICITNLPQGKHAVFWFTNYTKADVAFGPFRLEQQTSDGTWITNSFLTRTSSPIIQWRQKWIGLKEELAPGQGFIFSVPVLTNNISWRIEFNCGERAPVADYARDVIRHATNTNAAITSSKVFTGTRHIVKTPEVRNESIVGTKEP